MANCQITLKIKDFFPKIESLSLYNLKFLISNGNNISEIYFSNYKKEKYIHQPKVVNSDINYKIKLINCENSSLIGGSELIVPYNIITQINQINPIIYSDQIKLMMDQKTKRKIFGSLIREETIILSIMIEISLIAENTKNKSSNKIIKKIKNFEEVVQINNRINKKNVKNSTYNKFKSSNKNNNKTLSENVSQNQMNSYTITKENSSKTILKNSANNTSNIGFSYLNSENKRNQASNNVINKNINFKESPSTSFLKDSNNKIPKPINKNNKNKFINIDKNYFLINKNKNFKVKKENKENQENKLTSINNNKKDMDMKLFDYNQKVITIVKKNKGKNKKNVRSGNKNIKSAIKSMSSLNIYQNVNNKYLKIKNRSNKMFHTSCSSITLNNIRNEKYQSEQNFYKKGKTPKNLGNKNNIFFNNLIDNKDNKNKTIIKKNMSFNNFENKKTRKNKKLNINEINVKINDNLLKKNIIINNINNNNISIISRNELLNFQFKSHLLLLNELIRLFHKYKNFIKKNRYYKEKYLNEMKKINIIESHKMINSALTSIHLTNSKINEKIKNFVKIKRLENSIYQKIFDENNNIFNNNFIFVKNGDNKVNLIKNEKVSLLLNLVKNFIKNNGRISQIYNDNEEKKRRLQKILLKYGINEDEYFIKSNFTDKGKDINVIKGSENNIFDKNIRYKPIFNKDEIKIIKEEEGEDDDNDEEENDIFKKSKLINQKNVQLKKDMNKTQNNNNQNYKNMTPKYKNAKFKFNKKELKRNFSDINKNQIVVNNIIINNIKEKYDK